MDNYRVAPVAQHGPHAGACRRTDPCAVLLEDFLDAVFGVRHLFRLYVVVGCGGGGFGAAGVVWLAIAGSRCCGRAGGIGRYVVVGSALVLDVAGAALVVLGYAPAVGEPGLESSSALSLTFAVAVSDCLFAFFFFDATATFSSPCFCARELRRTGEMAVSAAIAMAMITTAMVFVEGVFVICLLLSV